MYRNDALVALVVVMSSSLKQNEPSPASQRCGRKAFGHGDGQAVHAQLALADRISANHRKVGCKSALLLITAAACGQLLSACSTIPGLDLSALKPAPAVEQVRIESVPPGADAKAASGATCRTPCTLGIPVVDASSITVALNGYVPQTVPVQVDKPTETRPDEFGAPTAHLSPNPVVVELEPNPPPQVQTKPAPKKRVVAHLKPPPASASTGSVQTSSVQAGNVQAAAPAPQNSAPAPGGIVWPTPR
jgi:hypothetical protein